MKAVMKKRLRTGLMLGALGITAVATVVSGREDPASELQAQPTASQPRIAAASAQGTDIASVDLDLTRLKRDPGAAPIPELFAAVDEPTGAARSAPKTKTLGRPAPPPEPPLPFKYLGKLIDEGKLAVFLTNGTVHYIAQPGQTIASQYRVDQISDASVAFTYLPSGSHKTLVIPSISASAPSVTPPNMGNPAGNPAGSPNAGADVGAPSVSAEGGNPPRPAAAAAASETSAAQVPGAKPFGAN